MAFELCGLLSEATPKITLDSLASELTQFFSPTEGFRLDREDDPFDPVRKNLRLRWGDWWARVFVEAGPEVASALEEIGVLAGKDAQARSIQTDRRIRLLFADDPNRKFTNHAVFMMDFLGTIPGLALFDPERKVFL